MERANDRDGEERERKMEKELKVTERERQEKYVKYQ